MERGASDPLAERAEGVARRQPQPLANSSEELSVRPRTAAVQALYSSVGATVSAPASEPTRSTAHHAQDLRLAAHAGAVGGYVAILTLIATWFSHLECPRAAAFTILAWVEKASVSIVLCNDVEPPAFGRAFANFRASEWWKTSRGRWCRFWLVLDSLIYGVAL